MSTSVSTQGQPSLHEALAMADLARKVVSARSLEVLVDAVLPAISRITGTGASVLYLKDPRLFHHLFLQSGLPAETAVAVEKLCAGHFRQLPDFLGESAALPVTLQENLSLALLPLTASGRRLGLLGLADSGHPIQLSPFLAEHLVSLLSPAMNSLVERHDAEKRNRHLNTYLTVSSMIAQALDLRDILEAVLFFCMDALSAEAASVLMLDYAKENFRFYTAEGEAKEVLLAATFPADQGLAGSVLQTQQAEIINDVQHDPRFFGKFDAESGFVTRNMMVLPLTAGEEKIGVLEVLNKIGNKPFLDEELLLLQSIAEEIAYAIRNARLFEVVVKSYCKQRQGLNTCKGCKRPLGSWTPCVKYREASGIME
jgi:GAF domain-containing protein